MGARHFGFGEETTWGTPVVPDVFFEALSENVQKQYNFESIETIRSFSPIGLVELSSRIAGDVEVLANFDGIGQLFKHLIGSADSTTAGAPYTHTFPAASGIPATDRIGLGLTTEFRRDGSISWKYAGCKITGLTHSFGTDQSSRMTISLLGSTEQTTIAPTSPTWPTLLPMYPKHVSFGVDGGTSFCARNVTLTVENPLDEPYCLGSTGFSKEPDRSGVLRVTGSAEVLFDSDAWTFYKANFDGESEVDLEIVADNTTESLTYNMNKCRITQFTPGMTGRERLVATLEWESYYDNDTYENLGISLVNNDNEAF